MAPRVVVVVGAGLAGLRTVERLRGRGYDGRLVLIGAESCLPYDRPPLSKEVLRGERDQPWLRAAHEYAPLDVQLHLDRPARALDVRSRRVRAGSGWIGYDALVIATGARPRRVPRIGGRVLRSWSDAQGLRSVLGPGVRLVVIGAGLIGCEVAASARSLGAEVDLVDVLPGPLAGVGGPAVSGARRRAPPVDE